MKKEDKEIIESIAENAKLELSSVGRIVGQSVGPGVGRIVGQSVGPDVGQRISPRTLCIQKVLF